ncbi:MAG: ABC transporter ATP-binding protein [Ruminiclostridium sp.]
MTKQYHGKHGIQGLNLTVSEGEVVALLGPNGAGKTTAMKAMMGMIPKDDGEARYKGISILNSPELTKNEIGMMIGDPSPYLYLTAYQYLKIHHNLYGEVTDEDIQEVLEMTGMGDRKNSRIKTFSTGMKQRIYLAKVLLIKPKLILLDEPFSGMDIEGRSQLVHLLKKIIDEKKVGMIISSHLIHDIEQITSKVCIVNAGRWLETTPIDKIKAGYPTIEEYYLALVSKRRNEK